MNFLYTHVDVVFGTWFGGGFGNAELDSVVFSNIQDSGIPYAVLCPI